MYIKRLLLIVMPFLLIISACTPEHSKIIVAEFGDSKITMGEFENAYSKNFGNPANVKKDSLDAYNKFLDLYVNYKMKLRDAVVRGYNDDPEMQKEIKDYKTNIGSTLYLENELYEPGMKRLYEKRKWELRASHIFISPDSTRNEAQCKEFEQQLIDSLKMGKDFATLAKKYSKDTYTKNIGGDVYYFTGGQIVAAGLEDAVYSTPVGEVYPEPVFSGYGFHILKITDKRPRRPMIQAQHILISLRDSTGKPLQDTTKAYEKAVEIKKKIEANEDFGELAKNFSDDKGSAAKNGDLGFFARGRMVREFDEAAFNLKKGEVSPIVKSQFGYHIIKLTDEKPIGSYDEEKETLRDLYKKNRYNSDYHNLVEKLKKTIDFKSNESNINKVISHLDSLKVGPKYWDSNLQKEIGNVELFSLNTDGFIADSLFMYMQNKKINVGIQLEANALKNALEKYESDMIINLKGMNYDKENKEFAKLMEEYENGVYLFKILDDEVWSKVSVDSNSVKDFWEKNSDNYKWNDRLEYKVIYEKNDSSANVIYKQLVSGSDFDELAAENKKQAQSNTLPSSQGLVDISADVLSQQANHLKNIGEFSRPFPYNDGWVIVKLVSRDPARVKTFDEAKAEVAGAVQENESKKLEQDYLTKLMNLYKPHLYYDELQNAFKN